MIEAGSLSKMVVKCLPASTFLPINHSYHSAW
jgi:hypothetical protein